MQVFLPYPSYAKSVRVLDDKRLKNQRNEALVIFRTLLGLYETRSWSHHPATLMWRTYEGSLSTYAFAACKEMHRRGIFTKHSDHSPFGRLVVSLNLDVDTEPYWLGDKKFHASHRSNLLAKDPEHYGQFGWREPDDLPYVWPTPRSKQTATGRSFQLKRFSGQSI